MPVTKRVGDCVTVVFDNDDLTDLLGPAAIKAAKDELGRFEYEEGSSAEVSAERIEVVVGFLLSVDRLAERQVIQAGDAAEREAA